ncbi:MFS transporter [Kordiimonas pumila]|uniref:MFS transporter n=1 Tax=Kordiimonas pumila TaxID=2161677 RepID=A0ABV7D4X6_9PROT|nr:MFS transporter [Kordiimonas pumila]
MKAGAVYDVNSNSARYSAFLFGVVGVLVFIVQPGLVQGLVSVLGMTEKQAGYIASAEMAGVALTTILISFFVGNINWRKLALLCVAAAVAGDVASIFWLDLQPLMLSRFIAGLGYGGLISISFGAIGLTRETDRNLALYLVWLLSYGAVGLFVMPTAFDMFGLQGLFAFFAFITLISVYFVKYLPASLDSQGVPSERAVDLSKNLKIIAMLGVLSYNLAQGIAWAYLFLIGTSEGVGEQAVANALTISQIMGIAGALLSVMLANKVRRLLPITVGIIGGATSMAILLADFNYTIYMIAVCGFNFLWNMVLPFILAKVGDFDRRGNMMVYAIALQMTGLGLGPYLGTLFIDETGFSNVIIACVGFFLISYILLLIPARARLTILKSNAKISQP